MIKVFVWLLVQVQMKADWSYAMKEYGELCVVPNGTEPMFWWPADS